MENENKNSFSIDAKFDINRICCENAYFLGSESLLNMETSAKSL